MACRYCEEGHPSDSRGLHVVRYIEDRAARYERCENALPSAVSRTAPPAHACVGSDCRCRYPDAVPPAGAAEAYLAALGVEVAEIEGGPLRAESFDEQAANVEARDLLEAAERAALAEAGTSPVGADGRLTADVRDALDLRPFLTPAADAIAVQPRPSGRGESVFAALRDDLDERETRGVATYGESLRTENGRRMIVDAYQEVLDLAVYLKGEIMERTKLEAQRDAAERDLAIAETAETGLRKRFANLRDVLIESAKAVPIVSAPGSMAIMLRIAADNIDHVLNPKTKTEA